MPTDTATRETTITFEPRGAGLELFTRKDPILLVVGPAGCVAGETRIYEPDTGTHTPIEELWREKRAPLVQTLWGPVRAEVPFLKGVAPLVCITLGSGRQCAVLASHVVLGPQGWCPVSQLEIGSRLLVSEPFPQTTIPAQIPSASLQGAGHFAHKAEGCRESCSPCLHLDGERLPLSSVGVQESAPSRSDAPARTHDDLPAGDQAYGSGRTRPCQSSDHPSTQGCSCLSAEISGRGCHAAEGIFVPSGAYFRSDAPFLTEIALPQPNGECHPHDGSTDQWAGRASEAIQPFSRSSAPSLVAHPSPGPSEQCFQCVDTTRQQLAYALLSDTCNSSQLASCVSHYTAQWDTVSSISHIGAAPYYDLHVPEAGHYLAEGIWHHNTGKTRAIVERLHHLCIKYAGIKVLFVRQTLQNLKTSVLETYREKVLHPSDGVIYYGGGTGDAPQFRYPNGSRIFIGGLDDPSKVMSTEYDIIYLNEAIETTIEAFENLSSRLRNDVLRDKNDEIWQQLIADTNPGSATHWLKKAIDEGTIASLNSFHTDNPSLWDDEAQKWTPAGEKYLNRLSNLTGVRRSRLFEGKWASVEGAVYPEWDATVHVIDPFKIPREWRRIVSIDFGYTAPFVAQWFAIDGEDRMYLYREIYMSNRTVVDLAPQIKKLSGAERIEAYIADHDAENRATLNGAGIKTIPARKKIRPGIQQVSERLRKAGDGKPRLFVFRDCLVETDPVMREMSRPTCFVEEIDTYVWPRGEDGKAIKEVPLQVDDHAMDCARYACMYLARKSPRVAPVNIERTTSVRNIA